MVKSILKNAIDYKEVKEIDPDDIDYDANLYETKLFNKTITFALGKPKHTFIDQNIVYYPMYLVEKDEIKIQLGLYEILANTQEEILDADGDIDLNKFDKPLLYAFTVGELAPKNKTAAAKKSAKGGVWIQKFMNDADFDIIDTPYDGNCFFYTIKMAMEENDQDVSIDDMRELLAANADESLFKHYKTLYDDLRMEEEAITLELKNITGRFKSLQSKLSETKDRNLQMSFSKQADEIKVMHDQLRIKRQQTREMLKEFEFMNGIDNLPMLRLKIKTRDYWADTWAISTLEREMNVKFIIFSEANFLEDDELNVLQCGQLNDTVLEERGVFEPSFYILVGYHGNSHYQMITYKGMKSLDFSELSESVKTLVKEKCLEKIAGPFSLIKEWMETPQQTQAPLSSDLYNSGTVFRFYSKSTDKPLPGKGAGEILGAEGGAAYDELRKIPQWRKKLSNFWPSEFKLDGHRWLTVEHYYQASKYKKSNKEFYIQFSLDKKDSSIAKDPVLAKAAGGKSGKFKGEQVRPKDVKMDSDFFAPQQGTKYTRAEQEMENAMRAKFTQNADLKALLIATKRAKLEHITRGKQAIVFNELMRVRRDMAGV